MTDPAGVPGDRGRWAWVLVVVVVMAAVPRMLGLGTQLWMDEILSLQLVGGLESPLQVFTGIHHDNNHYLNSLWLYGAGSDARAWFLRLPPVVLGVALVPLAALAVADRGPRTALTAALLTGLSYPLVHYSSEARGYAYVLFLALLAYMLFRRWLRDGGGGWAMAYSVCATLAFLAHLGFATVFAALVVWGLFEAVSVPGERTVRLARQVAAHALPVIVLGVLFLVDLRDMEVAGGPPVGTLTSWLAAIGLLAGSAPTWLTVPIAAAAGTAILLELRRMFAGRESEALFFAFVFLLPLANGVVSPNAYRRYYLTALLFALLLLSLFIGRLLARPGSRRRVATIVLGAVLAANVYQTVRFLGTGRGSYREAVAAMASASVDRPVTVAGNHDMGNILTIDYYARRLPDRPAFDYYCDEPMTRGCERPRPSREAGESPPEFFVLAGFGAGFTTPGVLEPAGLGAYELQEVYPAHGMSGISWAVYRAVP